MKPYKNIVAFIVINYLLFGIFLYCFQHAFLYYPTPLVKNHGLIETDFRINGDIIKTFVVNPGHDAAVLYFGGNAESVGYNAHYFKASLPERSVYLINYRGYGGSTGQPSEAALYSDALHIYDELARRHASIAVIGRSLGSAVATYLAAERNIEKLVLVTPFDSIEQVAQKKFPVYPISWILTDKYDSLARAARINADVLILVAGNDRIIRPCHSYHLIAAFPDPQVDVHVLSDSNHNSISRRGEYYRLIAEFLDKR
ncbi:alpha/beta fold hydrolase [Methylomarinum sp. Ch1-1]|uniref:Alpha/beta fold hydrolase n=1 Tax=Methylomarinum roseum TaxID=3067653 RepID=A0AAU7NZ10_9GAMM|nr:alpha/beta fold hydrolase [Methylomarinum sp. Ch1-1]MDP4521696.1 alpha/beta fold hydrolase [Methylomarinum sp. Ch1-1]